MSSDYREGFDKTTRDMLGANGGGIFYASKTPKPILHLGEEDPRGGVDEYGVFLGDTLIQDVIESIHQQRVSVLSMSEADKLALVESRVKELLQREKREDLLGAKEFSQALERKIDKLRKTILDLL